MAITATPPTHHPPKLVLGEILSFAYDTFCSNKVRFALTALGMVIGTASLILVVTIGMTGKQYVLSLIRDIHEPGRGVFGNGTRRRPRAKTSRHCLSRSIRRDRCPRSRSQDASRHVL